MSTAECIWLGRPAARSSWASTDKLAAVSVSSPALFLQGIDVRGNVIPPGANLRLYGMSFWPQAAATARRQAVNAMLALDGGHALRRAANREFSDGLQLADALAVGGSAAAAGDGVSRTPRSAIN